MKLNKNKCYLLLSGYRYENDWVKMEDKKIGESEKQKLIGTKVGQILSFDDHVFSLSKKGRKLVLLGILSTFMSLK